MEFSMRRGLERSPEKESSLGNGMESAQARRSQPGRAEAHSSVLIVPSCGLRHLHAWDLKLPEDLAHISPFAWGSLGQAGTLAVQL